MIEFITTFWLIMNEIIFPLFIISFIVLGLPSLIKMIVKQIKIKRQIKIENRLRKDDEKLLLSKKQILDSIVHMLKTKATYKIMTPTGSYDHPADREVLIEYHLDFLKHLGFGNSGEVK